MPGSKRRDELLNSLDPIAYVEFRTRIASDYAAGRVGVTEGGWIVSETELAAFGPASDHAATADPRGRKS
jgi:hypothetical protein